jgi:hypothetical protein
MTTRVMKGGVSQFMADTGEAPARTKDKTRKMKMDERFITPPLFPRPAREGLREIITNYFSSFFEKCKVKEAWRILTFWERRLCMGKIHIHVSGNSGNRPQGIEAKG